MTEMSCAGFVRELGGRAPVPGGGGASALVGAIGAALGGMVAALTAGKRKYADVEAEMLELGQAASRLQESLLELVQADADAFEPLSRAYGMPAGSEGLRAEKERVMEAALERACSVPLEIMRKCGEALELQREFARKGSRLAVSDAGAGALFCGAALEGASLNVFINTSLMKDRGRASALEAEAQGLLDEYAALAKQVYGEALAAIRG
jgi:formiminotetrahydrofolate cyclodeaminase